MPDWTKPSTTAQLLDEKVTVVILGATDGPQMIKSGRFCAVCAQFNVTFPVWPPEPSTAIR